MRNLTLLIIALMFCGDLCLDSNERLKEEVLDFVDYLKHKHEKHPIPASHDPDLSIKRREGETHADYLDNILDQDKKRVNLDIENMLEDLANSDSKDGDNKRESGEKSSSRDALHSAIPSNHGKPIDDATAKQHHAVEEIVYIRRSKSDLNDPIPDMIEKIVHDQPARRSPRDVQNRLQNAEQHAESSLADEACPIEDIPSHQDQTCTDGPEYEMKFHPAFSETLKSQMLDMLPKVNPEQESKCDFRKPLGPETGVEDRALCPFKKNITNRNPSRIPEYLYEAKCSCQVPNLPRPRRMRCVEVKRLVPVLWLKSCENGKRRYKQGWEEIAVACAPFEERMAGDSPDLDSHSLA